MTYWFLHKKDSERMASRFDDIKEAVNHAIAVWEKMTAAEQGAIVDRSEEDKFACCVICAPPSYDDPGVPDLGCCDIIFSPYNSRWYNMRRFRDAIADLAARESLGCPHYQVDIYVYPDGRVRTYDNIGGNSWIDDEHITALSIDYSGFSDDDFCDICYDDLFSDYQNMIDDLVYSELQLERLL